jgi:photosystem II stability/assembly factor-like uncharacterized protein
MDLRTVRRSGFGAAALSLGMVVSSVGCAGGDDQDVGRIEEALVSIASATWVAQGPAPIRNGQSLTQPPSNLNPVTGAVESIATHPTNANIIYAGTVNGGVWKTTNALATNPTWTPLTDFQPSLAIGAVALDRTNPNVVAAGTGCFSADNNDCGGSGPLLISRDAGATWRVINDPLFAKGTTTYAVVIRGNTLVVANGQLVRSTDGGTTWTRLTAIPANGLPFFGGVVDLVEDIQNSNRLYLTQLFGGVYRSDDLGATWVNISQNDPGTGHLDDVIRNSPGAAKIGVCQDGRAYIAVTDTISSVNYVGYTRDGGASWTLMDLPGVRVDPNPTFHFSVAGDKPNSSFVYITGIDNPMRGDAGIAATGQVPSPQWSPLAGSGTPHGTAPHVDSRDMAFDANLDLIEADDGGVFRRVRPRETTGDWFSLAGNMQDAEIHDIAYDANARVIVAGTQDNGTIYQLSPGQVPWTTFSGGDGGDVQVDTTSTPGTAIRYSSFQFFEGFTRSTFNASNVELSRTNPALTVVGGGPAPFFNAFITPLELNRANPHRLAVAAFQSIYESFDQGETISFVPGAQEANAMAYGHPANPDVIYAAAGNMFVRLTAGAPLTQTAANIPAFPVDVVIDPADFHKAYVATTIGVDVTPNAGGTWTDLTGNLPSLNPGFLRTIEFVNGVSRQLIVVGADHGAFAMVTSAPGVWQRIGTNLPLTPVDDLQYSRQGDLLVAGLLGRGAWSVAGLGGP